MNREAGLRHYRRKRYDDRLPKAAQQRDGHHNEQVKQFLDGKQSPRPPGQRRDQQHGDNAQRALQGEQQHALSRTPPAASAKNRKFGDVTYRQAGPFLLCPTIN